MWGCISGHLGGYVYHLHAMVSSALHVPNVFAKDESQKQVYHQ